MSSLEKVQNNFNQETTHHDSSSLQQQQQQQVQTALSPPPPPQPEKDKMDDHDGNGEEDVIESNNSKIHSKMSNSATTTTTTYNSLAAESMSTATTLVASAATAATNKRNHHHHKHHHNYHPPTQQQQSSAVVSSSSSSSAAAAAAAHSFTTTPSSSRTTTTTTPQLAQSATHTTVVPPPASSPASVSSGWTASTTNTAASTMQQQQQQHPPQHHAVTVASYAPPLLSVSNDQHFGQQQHQQLQQRSAEEDNEREQQQQQQQQQQTTPKANNNATGDGFIAEAEAAAGGGGGGSSSLSEAAAAQQQQQQSSSLSRHKNDKHHAPQDQMQVTDRPGNDSMEEEEEQEEEEALTASSASSSIEKKICARYYASPHGKETVLKRLSEALIRGTLTLINLSQRGLTAKDANLIKLAILHNPQLSVLKLGYNCLGDEGVATLASAIGCVDDDDDDDNDENIENGDVVIGRGRRHWQKHHASLSIIDLGFNCIGDAGCTSLATNVVSHNFGLKTLYLSGNTVGERGSIALAGAIMNGCGLTCLHLTANKIGTTGVKALTRAIAENEAKRQILLQEHQHQQQQQQQQQQLGHDGMEEEDVKTGSLQGRGGGVKLKSIQELFLGGVAMGPNGCLSVSNMVLTNFSLRVLSLSDNGIDDRDIALFSQSISRNKKVPLEVLQLSFNRLTCVGVESLMNAIWGSTTLREIRLDNNRIHDRGAQLAAVVLTSVKLEVLDLGFNRITTGGIKALMKSLAENDTLLSLTLSGNPLDTNASKAVSYALAYNKSLRALYVDNCSVGYAAQRHITAGIVSNSRLSLRVITGFHVGAIAVTLGLPSALENWTNEQVLKFIRLMWDRRRHEDEVAKQRCDQTETMKCDDSVPSSAKNGDATTTNNTTQPPAGAPQKNEKQKVGPLDPATVVAAAKNAFEALGDAGGALLQTEPNQRELSDGSPIVPADAIMLEKTLSGTVRVPLFENNSSVSVNSEDSIECVSLGLSLSHMSTESLSVTNLRSSAILSEDKKKTEPPIDPIRKKKNMEWLRQHFFSLNEVAQLPFNDADLWKLHQYFFSPIDSPPIGNGEKVEASDAALSTCQSDKGWSVAEPSSNQTPSNTQKNDHACSNGFLFQSANFNTSEMMLSYPGKITRKTSVPGLSRKVSYRFLSDAVSGAPTSSTSNSSGCPTAGQRRTLSVLGNNGAEDPISQPASKRARNNKPRIAYYPRIREKLELLRSKADQQHTLVLLRQLKFLESVMFKGRDIYSETRFGIDDPDLATSTGTIDAEIILVDML